jgi:tRNA C32,U32 (ribose-2'-O)-methylase TrmJ
MIKVMESTDEITKDEIDVNLLEMQDRFRNEKPNAAQMELAVILLKKILNRFKLDESETRLIREILNQVTYL